MKRNPIRILMPVLFTVCLTVFLHAEDAPSRAHIPHKIPDGSPPPPAPPKPVWRVAPSDILSEKIHHQDGRAIKVREIKPIPLPSPPETQPSSPPEITPELRERIAGYREKHAHHKIITMGATIYKLEGGKTRSHLRVWGNRDEAPVSFISPSDFSLLSGVGAFTDKHGETRALFMISSTFDIPRLKQFSAARGREHTLPEIPDLPDEQAAFIVESGNPAPELLASISALHEILNDPGQNLELRQAAAKRETAARLRAEELKKNPPQPKDIILHHWRVAKP